MSPPDDPPRGPKKKGDKAQAQPPDTKAAPETKAQPPEDSAPAKSAPAPEYPLRSKSRTPRPGVPSAPAPADESAPDDDYPFTSKRKPASESSVPEYPFTSKHRRAPNASGEVSHSVTGTVSGSGSAAVSGTLSERDDQTGPSAPAAAGAASGRTQRASGSVGPPDDAVELDASELVEADIADDRTFPEPSTFGGPTFGGSPSPTTSSAGPTAPTAVSAEDDAILPPAYHDGALLDAVGAAQKKTRKDDGGGYDDSGKANRRMIAIVALAIVGILVIASCVFLGRANAQRYLISCTTDNISPEQGRSFPPWGSKPLSGSQWKPIALPSNAECKPRETDEVGELEHWYLDLLVDRASTTLTSKNLLDTVPGVKGGANPLDVAAEQLNQALLLSRAPERRDQRKEVERLLGDVQYWRATLRLRDANVALVDAAKQFDAAAAQRPRHVTDSAAWSTFLHRLVDDLHAGPNGQRPTAAGPSEEHPSAPMGVALPTETPSEGSGSDATPAPPDAGVPTGGVLL